MKAKLFALIAVSPSLASVLYIAYRVLFVRANHVGLTPHYLDIFSVMSILLALVFRLDRTSLWVVALLATVNVLVVVWAIDANILVEYEAWIRRGMPEKTVGFGAH